MLYTNTAIRKLLVLFVLAIGLVNCRESYEGEDVYQEVVVPMECMFFFIPDCPASRSDMPLIMDLSRRYGPHGLVIHAILSDPNPNDSILKAAITNYDFTLPIQFDTTLSIAKMYGATTTPQVFLFNMEKRLVYSGQVNNYYYQYGKHRARVTQDYLEDAVKGLLEGNPIDISQTSPIGCRINFN